MVDPRWRRLARLRLYSNASCIVAIALGGLVLCGWIFHNEFLKSGLLDSGPIEVNTSLGFLFLGSSLWLLLPDPPRQARFHAGLFFAALVAFLGTLTVVECVSGLNLHIDQFGFRQDAGVLATNHPGRMSPSTAATFFALGLALLLLDEEPGAGRRPAQVLTFGGVLAAILSLSGYINGASATFRIFSFTPVAVYVALVLAMMSVAILFARPRAGIAGDLTGGSLGSAMARRFLPAVIIVPILAAWLRMRVQRAGFFGIQLGLSINVAVNVVTLSLLVWLNARQLNRAEESLENVREAKDRLYDASLRDELTGLYNRRGFLTFAEEQVKLACSGRRGLLVVFADVDGLKAINDGHGHSEGDRALKKTAEVLLTVFRDTDLVARLGGDEFAVLALDCSAAGQVRINAHLDKVLRIVNDQGYPWRLSISVGTVQVDSRHQLSLNELLSKADTMMYEQKREKLVGA
jgi:diguanylate cyclase (GGDEF)-like protein